MQLYTAPKAPNPRRVTMFMAEKGITGIRMVPVDLNTQEHKGDAFRAKSPLAKVPALELDDGRNPRHLHLARRAFSRAQPDGPGF